MVIFQNNFNQG